jgi:hypothetical protein
MLRVGVVVHLRQDDSYGDGYVEGLNYYPNSVVQRASSRNAAWLLD